MKAKRQYGFEPDYAVPPGATLKDTIESLDMSQAELAKRADLTVQTINRIIKGDQPITFDTANRLELVTGVPARFWNNLESNYQEQQARIKELEEMERDIAWLKTIPTKELIDRGEIEPQQDKVLLLREVLGFYGVNSVSSWHSVWDEPAVAARRSPCFESHPGPASAWIRMGERQAQKIDCKPYNAAMFSDALVDIRAATVKDPDEFIPLMQDRCAAAGVAVAFVPEMKKVPWNGATEWLSPDKAMILMNIRGKYEDKFWFSFFHEAGHVLHDKKKCVFINNGSEDDPAEVRANDFAASFLIPSEWNEIIADIKSAAHIRRLANQIGVSPGIVAGRYHLLTDNWGYFKSTIRKLGWKAEE
jgi:HTH-type transcriptional regulator / antitoxin HigA